MQLMSRVEGIRRRLNFSRFQTFEPVPGRACSSRITADVPKNGCWQRTGIWANWIYCTAEEGGGVRGWLGLGLDQYALQNIAARVKSISKRRESTSSREKGNTVIVAGPCRQPAFEEFRHPPHPDPIYPPSRHLTHREIAGNVDMGDCARPHVMAQSSWICLQIPAWKCHGGKYPHRSCSPIWPFQSNKDKMLHATTRAALLEGGEMSWTVCWAFDLLLVSKYRRDSAVSWCFSAAVSQLIFYQII